MIILSTIPPIAIHGLERGADTGREETQENGAGAVSGPAGDCIVPGIIVTETVQVDIEDSQPSCSLSRNADNTFEKCTKEDSREKKKNKRPLGMEDLMELKRKD